MGEEGSRYDRLKVLEERIKGDEDEVKKIWGAVQSLVDAVAKVREQLEGLRRDFASQRRWQRVSAGIGLAIVVLVVAQVGVTVWGAWELTELRLDINERLDVVERRVERVEDGQSSRKDTTRGF